MTHGYSRRARYVRVESVVPLEGSDPLVYVLGAKGSARLSLCDRVPVPELNPFQIIVVSREKRRRGQPVGMTFESFAIRWSLRLALWTRWCS